MGMAEFIRWKSGINRELYRFGELIFCAFSGLVFSALDGIGFAEPWLSALEARLTFFCFAKRK
jgi:hypothetical protein